MLLSAHIAEVGLGHAMKALLIKPDPAKIQGLRYAETWLTASLRSGVMPSLDISGVMLIAGWDDDESLDRFLYHPRAKLYENGWRVRLAPARSIGVLRDLPDLPRQERHTADLPLAALTIARVRANRFLSFSVAAGAAEREATGHPGFIEGLTLIRPPLRIGTFSLWRNLALMRAYALESYPGGHLKAMRKDQAHSFHHEMSFSRYVPYAAEGQWKGRNPLAMLAHPRTHVYDSQNGLTEKANGIMTLGRPGYDAG